MRHHHSGLQQCLQLPLSRALGTSGAAALQLSCVPAGTGCCMQHTAWPSVALSMVSSRPIICEAIQPVCGAAGFIACVAWLLSFFCAAGGAAASLHCAGGRGHQPCSSCGIASSAEHSLLLTLLSYDDQLVAAHADGTTIVLHQFAMGVCACQAQSSQSHGRFSGAHITSTHSLDHKHTFLLANSQWLPQFLTRILRSALNARPLLS
jgi:hypothetical protein